MWLITWNAAGRSREAAARRCPKGRKLTVRIRRAHVRTSFLGARAAGRRRRHALALGQPEAQLFGQFGMVGLVDVVEHAATGHLYLQREIDYVYKFPKKTNGRHSKASWDIAAGCAALRGELNYSDLVKNLPGSSIIVTVRNVNLVYTYRTVRAWSTNTTPPPIYPPVATPVPGVRGPRGGGDWRVLKVVRVGSGLTRIRLTYTWAVRACSSFVILNRTLSRPPDTINSYAAKADMGETQGFCAFDVARTQHYGVLQGSFLKMTIVSTHHISPNKLNEYMYITYYGYLLIFCELGTSAMTYFTFIEIRHFKQISPCLHGEHHKINDKWKNRLASSTYTPIYYASVGTYLL